MSQSQQVLVLERKKEQKRGGEATQLRSVISTSEAEIRLATMGEGDLVCESKDGNTR